LLEIGQKLDWQEIEATSSKLLSRLVGFDTSNPPGHTEAAARFLYEFLFEEGVFATLLPTEGDKRNLVAQVDGSGQFDPFLLLSPLDVVKADPSTWSEFNPFSGYDDGTHIWGRGTIAAKSLLVAQIMAVVLINRLGLPLKRHLRVAAVADGFGSGNAGLEYFVENHLPLIEAERCLTWGFPPSVELSGKTIFTLSRAERGSLRLFLRAEGKPVFFGEPDAARILMNGISALTAEFSADFGSDDTTGTVYESLQAVTGDETIVRTLSAMSRYPDPGVPGDRDTSILPDGLTGYLRSLNRTQVAILHLNAGSSADQGTRSAEAEIKITPCPGMSLFDCGTRAVSTLEALGTYAPYIAKAEQFRGSVSPPDDELRRILTGAIRSAVPDAELVDGICPFAQGLDILRQLGISVYGFQPIQFMDGLEDGANRVFGDDERIAKSTLGNMVRIMFEACVRLAS